MNLGAWELVSNKKRIKEKINIYRDVTPIAMDIGPILA
jgi:hypothetical protein